MSRYTVTGASGHLAHLVVQELLERGVPAHEIVAVVRTLAKAADLADLGVELRQGDYSQPDTLPAALAGTDRLLLISASEPGRRIAQHRAVIDAAGSAGVERIVYTSILHADTTGNPLAPEHKATEELLHASGLLHTVLRNGWYTENYTSQLGQYLERGEILGAAGAGRVSAATRADYAAAAAAALTTEQHHSAVHELGGSSFSLAELAQTISEVTGLPVRYRSLSTERFAEALQAAGLDAGNAGFVASLDESIARGELETDSPALVELAGRPSTPLAEAIRGAQG